MLLQATFMRLFSTTSSKVICVGLLVLTDCVSNAFSQQPAVTRPSPNIQSSNATLGQSTGTTQFSQPEVISFSPPNVGSQNHISFPQGQPPFQGQTGFQQPIQVQSPFQTQPAIQQPPIQQPLNVPSVQWQGSSQSQTRFVPIIGQPTNPQNGIVRQYGVPVLNQGQQPAMQIPPRMRGVTVNPQQSYPVYTAPQPKPEKNLSWFQKLGNNIFGSSQKKQTPTQTSPSILQNQVRQEQQFHPQQHAIVPSNQKIFQSYQSRSVKPTESAATQSKNSFKRLPSFLGQSAQTQPITQPGMQPSLKSNANPNPPNALKPIDTEPAIGPNGEEIIRTRFANGKVKIEKGTVQDSDGNYINQGSWKQFQPDGTLIASGNFEQGQRHGKWTRWYFAEENPQLKVLPFKAFKGPFLSTSDFKNGKLNGTWTMTDRNTNKIVSIQFTEGKRQGTATWFHPSGFKLREIQFNKGEIHGTFSEWNSSQQLVKQQVYREGHPVITQKLFHDRAKKSLYVQQTFLGEKVVEASHDNWWDATFANYTVDGTKVAHGPVAVWYPNGQLKMKGEYKNGERIGEFVWWHENGQKQTLGHYREGERAKEWVWWHPNGYKSIQGQFEKGSEYGVWKWWNTTGKLAKSLDYSDPLQQFAGDSSEEQDIIFGGSKSIQASPASTKKNN